LRSACANKWRRGRFERRPRGGRSSAPCGGHAGARALGRSCGAIGAARHATPSPTRARGVRRARVSPVGPSRSGIHARRDRSRKSRDEDAPALRAWTFLVTGSAGGRGDGRRGERSALGSRVRGVRTRRSRPRASRGARTANAQGARSTRRGTSRALSRRGSNARAGTHSRRPRPSWRETCKPF